MSDTTQQGGQTTQQQTTTTTSTGGGSTGGAQTDFRTSLPEDLRNDPSLATFTDVGTLARSYVMTKAKVGQKGFTLPGEKATDEDWGNHYNEVFKAAGVDPEKYSVSTPSDYQVNKDLVGKFTDWSKKAGLLPRQAQAVLNSYIDHEKSVMSDFQARRQADVDAGFDKLKKEYGQAFNPTLQKAKNLVAEYGGKEVQDYLMRTGLDTDPVLQGLLMKVARATGEESLRGGSGGDEGIMPQEIDDKIRSLQADPAFWQANHPQHHARVREYERLNKMKTAGL